MQIKQTISNLWHGRDTLGGRFMMSTVVIFVEKFFIRGLQLIRTIIVARLLFPSDVGLFGLAALAMTLTETFVQTGFNSAIVQEKENNREYLDSAWTIQVVRGVLLSLLLFFVAAPLAGKFFENDMIVPLARALALVFLISGFENLSTVLLQKELRFVRIFVYDLAVQGAQVVTIIVAAFILKNAWALLLGTVVNRIVAVIMSYAIYPYRPHFTKDLRGARHLFQFGKWIALTGIISFFISRGDAAVVGKVLDESSLGFYQMAFALALLPAGELVGSFEGLLFPLYAQVQDDVDRIKTTFVRVSRVLFAFAIPASAGLFVLSSETVRMIYGERWLPAIAPLQVLVFLGFIRAFEYAIKPLFLGVGKPKIQLGGLIIQFVVMAILIVPFTKLWGMIGTALAVLAASGVVQLVYIWNLRATIDLGFRTLLRVLGLPLVGSFLMGIAILYAKRLLPISNPGFFIMYIAGGALFYFGVFFLLDWYVGKKEFFQSLLWVKERLGSKQHEVVENA